ncbi:unnamed protein product, partial [Coregonus sp. 'balchen']
MSKLELFNAYLTERLTAAAMEITSAVERTITDYQEEISRSKEENERLRLLLDFKPHLHPAAQSENSVNSGRDNDGESREPPSGSKPRKSQRKQKKKKGTSFLEDAAPYCCKLCGRTFVRMGFLVNHVQRTHTKHAEQYRCGVCEVVLDSKANLTVH